MSHPQLNNNLGIRTDSMRVTVRLCGSRRHCRSRGSCRIPRHQHVFKGVLRSRVRHAARYAEVHRRQLSHRRLSRRGPGLQVHPPFRSRNRETRARHHSGCTLPRAEAISGISRSRPLTARPSPRRASPAKPANKTGSWKTSSSIPTTPTRPIDRSCHTERATI